MKSIDAARLDRRPPRLAIEPGPQRHPESAAKPTRAGAGTRVYGFASFAADGFARPVGVEQMIDPWLSGWLSRLRSRSR